MEALSSLLGGFGTAFSPMNLAYVIIGAALGTAVGVLPGLGSAMAVALLLPLTFTLDPTGAFIMFAAIYFGGLFGDSTAGILLNTPGNSTAIATTFEGHRMALDGRAAQALATSAIGAFVGGLLATTVVAVAAPVMAVLATAFGPAEYFALALFAFVATAAVVGGSVVRGLSALGIGLALALIGIDTVSGAARFTLGIPQLFDGFSIVVITVGLLAIGEVLHVASRGRSGGERMVDSSGRPWLSGQEFREAAPAWGRGAVTGLPFGVIPVGGAEIPTFLAYGNEKRIDGKKARRFGKRGAIRGVAAPEAAGNATAGTAVGALLTLGLPTSATAALMLAAFQQYGLQPGPLLFERDGDLVWALIASMFLGLVVLLILNLPFAPLWAKLLLIPKPYLYAGITLFAVLGVYAVGSSVVDLVVLVGIGAVGFLMRRHGIPLAPVLIGVILGPLAETSLRRALAVSEGSPLGLVNSPITVGLYLLLVAAVALAAWTKVRARRLERELASTPAESEEASR